MCVCVCVCVCGGGGMDDSHCSHGMERVTMWLVELEACSSGGGACSCGVELVVVGWMVHIGKLQ